MRIIPIYLRTYLEEQKRMRKCAVYPLDFGYCEGKLEWDHVWIYAGKQINEIFAIVALCKKHHKEKEGNMALNKAIRLISLNLATSDELAKYPRKDWAQERRYLQAVD